MCDPPVQQERPPVTSHPGSCDADDLQAVAGIGFWNWDTRSDLVTWSDELFRICGLEPQSAPVTYDSYLETVHPGERDMVRSTIAHSCRTGQSFSIDHRIVRPDGGVRWLHCVGDVWMGPDGPTRLFGTAQDISSRRHAEERALAFFAYAGDLMFSLGFDGRLALVNPAWERVLGWAAAEVLGRPLFELVHPDDRAAVSEHVRRLAGREETASFEIRLERRSGGHRRFLASATSLAHDELVLVVALDPDCCEPGETPGQEPAGESPEWEGWDESSPRSELAAIVDSSEDAIIGQSLAGIITSWNLGAVRLFGYSSREIVGRPASVLVPTTRKDELTEVLTAIASGETVQDFETLRVRKGQEEVWVSLTMSPIRDRRGRIVGASTIARDVSGRRRTERALREAIARFGSAFSHALVGMALVRLDGRLLQANPAYCRLTGYSEQELATMCADDLTYPGDRHKDRTYLEQMLSGRIPSYRVEKRFRRSDGQIVPAVLGVSLVLGRGGSPLHLIYQLEPVVQRLADESPGPDPGTGEGGPTAATHQVVATRPA
jgi:PAS domain S-box-containing protein